MSMVANDRGGPASRGQVIAGLVFALALVGVGRARAAAPDGLTASVQAIHQEVSFDAPPGRVYALLTDEHEFQMVVALSGAAQSGKIKPTIAARIGHSAGGSFSIFGGFVVGRNIELVPDKRLVQAWRPQDWAPGVYSIVKFELLAQGAGTLLKFDQTGFPADDAQNLASGWKMNYWQPMATVLAHP
jgi:activator of HSP90 ATPase